MSRGVPRVPQPRLAICACGHTGNTVDSAHGPRFADGHGACKTPGCKCRQFTWVSDAGGSPKRAKTSRARAAHSRWLELATIEHLTAILGSTPDPSRLQIGGARLLPSGSRPNGWLLVIATLRRRAEHLRNRSLE